jgi:hypothetical protein
MFRPVTIFGGALALMCIVWFFGIATRVSLNNDIEIVGRAGISRVLTGGFSDFRDTFLLIALACVCYGVCLWALHKGFRHDLAAAVGGTVLAGMSMLPAMPLTSPDAVHLAADVRTFWIYHKNPTQFSGTPNKTDDPVNNAVRVYRGAPSGYGPLAYAIGGAPLPFVGDNFTANLVGQKVLGGIFLTLTAASAGLLARRLGRNGALVAGIIGLNPMMTWQYPGDGHNDAMMAFFGVIALWLVMEQGWLKRGGGVAAWGASALCKYAFVLASPVVAAWWWPRFRNPLAFLTALAGGFVLFLYVIDAGPIVNGVLGPANTVIETSPYYLLGRLFDVGQSGRDRMVVGGYAMYLLLVGLVMMYHRLETKLDLCAAVGLVMTMFLYACTPAYHPWYIIWCLPFAALSGKRWLMTFGAAFALAAFLPVLALNWYITLAQTWNLQHAVDWSVVLMWSSTALAGYIGWRGRNWAQFTGIGQPKRAQGPRFQQRGRKRAQA